MRTSFLFTAVACAATAAAQIRLPFSRQSNQQSGSADKRALPNVDLLWSENSYYVNVTVGTPPQEISLQLTVQSDLSWVPASSACTLTPALRRGCSKYGSFEANASSTFVEPDAKKGFSIYYTDGWATGDIMTETLSFGGLEIPEMTLGLVDSTDYDVGTFALGFNGSGPDPYLPPDMTTIPDRLLLDGLINSTAYSLWVDDDTAETGNVLLGAIDKSKFEGPLVRFATLRSVESWPSDKYFDTTIDSVNASKSSAEAMRPIGNVDTYDTEKRTVRLIPHSSLSRLPEELARDIYELAGAVWDADKGLNLVPCSAGASTARLSMQLHAADGPVLDVPVADLVVPEEKFSEERFDGPDAESGTAYCIFNVLSGNVSRASSVYTYDYALGGAFLKNAYMVFDIANEEIGFAKTRFDSTAAEDVVPFPSYGAKIPESTEIRPRWCSGTSASELCKSEDSGSGSDVDRDPGIDYDRPWSPNNQLSLGAKIGIGIGVGVFVLLVAVFGTHAIMRRRRMRRRTRQAEMEQSDHLKRIDMEDGVTGNVGNGNGHDASLPQQPPAAATREPAATGEQLTGPAR